MDGRCVWRVRWGRPGFSRFGGRGRRRSRCGATGEAGKGHSHNQGQSTAGFDHQDGEWFESTDWQTGRPLTLIKGHEWKEPYHGARALMEVSQRLSKMIREPVRQRPS